MPNRHNSGGTVQGLTKIIAIAQFSLAGMYAHAHFDFKIRKRSLKIALSLN